MNHTSFQSRSPAHILRHRDDLSALNCLNLYMPRIAGYDITDKTLNLYYLYRL
jgi:hypothetical protein